MKEPTIIIVTFKSVHIIPDALKNIVNKGYRIIIVDNASNDNIESFLKEKYPNSGIELILLKNNCGFSKANNVALKMVETDFVLLLNPDAIIRSESIENLLKCAKKEPEAALIGAIDIKSETPDEESQKNAIENYRKIFKVTEENDDYMSVNFLCGGYLMLRMNVFREIGFFDEKLFLYGDDDEVCGRSIRSGYKNILAKNAFTFHRDHSATKTDTVLQKYYLLYKRYWYMGWSKAYLKRRKKNYFLVFIKAVIQLFSVLLYLAKFDLNRSIIRFGRSLGGLSNLLGIDCFNKKNRIVEIKKHVKI